MNEFADKIVRELEMRKAYPKPRWHFLLSRWVFWMLAISSVLVGAVAFSVAEYVFFDNDGASLASLEKSNILDLAQGIPYIWLAILGLFIFCAYYGFRQTKKAYKYATLWVVVGVITASVLFGQVLSEFDFGKLVHIYLLKHTSFYDPLIFSRDDLTD